MTAICQTSGALRKEENSMATTFEKGMSGDDTVAALNALRTDTDAASAGLPKTASVAIGIGHKAGPSSPAATLGGTLQRFGSVVIMAASYTTTSAATGAPALMTIPNGYKPSGVTTAIPLATDGSGTAVLTSGTMYASASTSTHSVGGAWITADDMPTA